ncbi:MAG: RNA polymerase sigma factor [Clostridia bacterium]
MNQQENLTPVPDETIIRQYADMVYRLAYAQTRSKSDADDIFQEVFLRYIQRKPDFASEEHCKAWFLRVTVNCAKKHWGSWWFRHTAPLEESILFPDPEESRLDEALKILPPAYRTAIHLFYYEGYSTAEIARITGSRESTVRTRLTRARKKLAEALKGDDLS